MTDRADELARRLVRVLPDGDGFLGIDVAGTWFDWPAGDKDPTSDIEAAADDIITKLAATLRAYAEEARGLEGEWYAGLNAILSTRVAVLLTALGEIRGACVVKPHRFATQAQAILAIVEPVLFDDRRSAERYAATVRARGEKG